jgi:uncharacterized protein (TIGR02145 family)
VSGSFVDSRDGKVYPTLTFGTTTWMAANLAFASKDSWCYGDDESRGKQLGRLYTWAAAQQACPKGWHVATREEWYTLIRLAGGRSSCGMKLKSQSLWVGGVPILVDTTVWESSARSGRARTTARTAIGAWISTSGCTGAWSMM